VDVFDKGRYPPDRDSGSLHPRHKRHGGREERDDDEATEHLGAIVLGAGGCPR
jgi:hypothetical protein